MSRYPRVSLGDHVSLSLDEVEVEPSETYKPAGIYSFGKGLFARQPISGIETKYRKFFRLHEGQLVLSRLNGWEGAVAVVPASFQGHVVSQEYPTFDLAGDLDPEYLRWICRWSDFWVQLVPRGSMVRRKRSHPERLLEATIPLPSTREQKRISSWLDRLHYRAGKLIGLAEESKVLSNHVVDSTLRQLIEQSGWSSRPLINFSQINPSPKPKAELGQDLTVTFVPMSAVDDRTGTIATLELRPLGDVGNGYKQFLEGDVIFARITPCMQNGKSAVATNLKNGIGYGSTEFHVLRPGPELDARWLHFLLRSKEIRDLAQSSFKGTAGQQRVPATFLESLEVPIPSLEEQRDAIRLLERVRGRIHEIHARRAHSKIEMKALIPATLNSLFGTS